MRCAVLATPIDVRILRPTIAEPPLPHIFHPAICAYAGGVGCVARALQLAVILCQHYAPLHCSAVQPGIPRNDVELDAGLHLEQAESRRTTELPRTSDVQGAVAALGADSVQCGLAWALAEG